MIDIPRRGRVSILLMANTKEEVKLMGALAVALLERLRFTVNFAKSLLEPVQSIQFLGFSLELEMTIPNPKMEKMRGKARDLLSQERTTGRELASTKHICGMVAQSDLRGMF